MKLDRKALEDRIKEIDEQIKKLDIEIKNLREKVAKKKLLLASLEQEEKAKQRKEQEEREKQRKGQEEKAKLPKTGIESQGSIILSLIASTVGVFALKKRK